MGYHQSIRNGRIRGARTGLGGLRILAAMLYASGALTVGPEAVKAWLEQRMREVREARPLTEAPLATDEATAKEILSRLAAYEGDESRLVRAEVSRLAMRVSAQVPTTAIRRDVVGRLLRAVQDRDPLVWQQAFKFLLTFRESDFDDTAKASALRLLDQAERSREAARLCGAAGAREAMARLSDLANNGPPTAGEWYGSVGWAARLALARMGSDEDIDDCLAAVKAERRDVIRVTRLLHDVAYIRRPAAVLYLAEVAQSDEALPRLSDVPSVKHCQYAIDLLAMILEEFPVESTGPGGYSDADVDRCREWLAQQTTWNIVR